MSVIANINTGTNAVPAVPSSAIASSGGNDFIFIQVKEDDHEHGTEEVGKDAHKEADEHNHKDGDTAMDHKETDEYNHAKSEKESTQEANSDNFYFKRVQVKKGVTSDGFTEILPLEQIPERAQVVTNGSFYLMAMLTNSGEEGHAH
jgi:cobalt-zinc-cadmium efflux system membrane fusion protein